MLSVSGRDSISASPLRGALWLSETSRACGRQRTCTTDNSSGSYGFCWSLKWRWMRAQYLRPPLLSRVTLRFQHAAFVMRDGFEMSRPELLRTLKCFVDRPFHNRKRCSLETYTKQKLRGCLKGVHAAAHIHCCGLIC